MYAVIKTGGKQYLVKPKDKVKVEKLPAKEGGLVKLDQVLLLADEKGEKVTLGKPLVEGALVEARVLNQGKADKITVIKYKAKVRYRRKRGHRQPFTLLEISRVVTK